MIDLFISGYLNGGGALPENWVTLSRIIDLASMCSFITREGNISKTVNTALTIFKKVAEEL